MPKAGPVQFRLYCICGQKMKVSEAMYGRPAKCIACRQKIRVPRPDQFPEGVTELYLKDHPEFLRKSRSARLSRETPPVAEERENAVVKEEAKDELEPVPLDMLEPLRLLCSFEHKIHRQFEALRGSGEAALPEVDKATLMSYRGLVRNARSRLDEKMHARLRDTVRQLATENEEIARLALKVRVGEREYPGFSREVLVLRRRRERLERRRQNLRGWLAVSDPWMAGGYTDVPLGEVPCEDIEIAFPSEPKSDRALVDECIENLRTALAEREKAERQLGQWRRMKKEGTLAQSALEDYRAQGEAGRARARTAVAFCRRRLEQAVQDTESDTKAIKAHLELARGRLQVGELDKAAYQSFEMDLLRSQTDNNQARDLARRALNANSSSDVPRSRGTFLHRLARPERSTGLGADSWIAGAAALLMMLNIFVPLSGAQVRGNLMVLQGMVIALFLSAALMGMVASIPKRAPRGVLLTVLWAVFCVGGAYVVHRAHYGFSPAGVAMRADPYWYLSAGILLLVLTGTVSGAAACFSLMPIRRLRTVPLLAFFVILAGMAAILSDGAGFFSAKPRIEEPGYEVLDSGEALYGVTIAVANDGWRPLWLATRASVVPAPMTYVLERRIGTDSWEDVSMPDALRHRSAPDWRAQRGDTFPAMDIELPGGDALILRYRLESGSYRVQLRSALPDGTQWVKAFSLAPFEPAPSAAEVVEAEPSIPRESAEESVDRGTAIQIPARAGVAVELRGIITGEGRDPQFPLRLYLPDGQEIQKHVTLGEEIYGPWRAIEFSPTRKSLTVGDGERLLILKTGERYRLQTRD